jgi:hypothetical protein
MAVPEGLPNVPDGHILQLIKALYSLKQAGRQWYKTLKEVMEKFGMKKIESDPHCFIVTRVVNQVTRTLIIPIWVDDLFPFGDKVLTDDFERWIPKYFAISPPIDAHYFLGIHVTRNWTLEHIRLYIALNQITFIKNVIDTISVMYEKDITVHKTVLPAAPIVPHSLPKIKANAHTVRIFQSTVRQLMYIMLAT